MAIRNIAVFVPRGERLMEALLTDFLHFLQEERKYSENTTAAYRNDLSQFMRFLSSDNGFGLNEWTQVTAAMVDDYVNFIKSKSYASSSVARKVAALKSFFHFLYARSYIASDPTTNIDSPKVQKRLPQTLSAADVERLLAAPAGKETPKHLRDRAILHLLYATGMRVTELVSLAVEDVDMAGHSLLCATEEDPQRRLPFDDHTAAILEKYLAHGRPQLVKDDDEHALFLNHRGQQLTRQGLWLIIKTYARQAELGAKVTPHTLRHSFAAHKLDEGAKLQEIQQLLGHANISTTQIYTQLGEDEK